MTSKDGGDISSGHGESTVEGPVSDEKAQQMLHDDEGSTDEDDTTSGGDQATNQA